MLRQLFRRLPLSLLKRSAQCRRGVAMIEFALMLPVLFLLFGGGVEFTRFILIHQKLDKATNQIADLTTQLNSVTTCEIDDMLSAMPQLLKPFSTAGSIQIVSIVVDAPGSGPVVRDQYTGGGSLAAASNVGAKNGPATIPNFTMVDGDEVVTVEIFYRYEPILDPVLDFFGIDFGYNPPIYKLSIFRPRLGALQTFKSC